MKALIDSWASSPAALPRALARVFRKLGHVRRFIVNPRIRSEQVTRILHGGAHIQGATYSEPDRYPELFAACRDRLVNVKTALVVSFGCSTGEEVFALARYLPRANIIGADINRWCLRRCREANHNPQVSFVHALSPDFAALTDVDAIFAMAVFQRSENRNHTGPTAHRGFPFARFEEEITRLDGMLKPGGLLFIGNADFRFEDTAIAAKYAPLECAGSSVQQDRPLFGPDNRLIATRHVAQRAFVKRSEAKSSLQ